MSIDINSLIDEYLRFLKSNIDAREIDKEGWVEITTPFLDRHNDYLQIYVKRENGSLFLTDGGWTVSDLVLSGLNLTSRRKDLIRIMVRGAGVQFNEETYELYTRASVRDFPEKKHRLLQAMLSVDDLFVLTPGRVKSFFFEDVRSYLEANGIRFVPSVIIAGRTQFNHRFDFVIPYSESKPERLIKLLNNPTRQKVELIIFAYQDIREAGTREFQGIVMMNDMGREIKTEIIEALTNYDVLPILWSERDTARDLLAA